MKCIYEIKYSILKLSLSIGFLLLDLPSSLTLNGRYQLQISPAPIGMYTYRTGQTESSPNIWYFIFSDKL